MMWNETVAQAIQLLVQGMGGIFVVLGVIALAVVGLQKLDQRRDDK